MATETGTMTQYDADWQEQKASPESFELSFKSPGRTLKEISRRIADASKRKDSSEEEDDDRNDVPPPATAQSVQQRWNKPKGNVGRLAFAFLSFLIAGMNDAAVGVGSFPPITACILNPDFRLRLSYPPSRNTISSTTPSSPSSFSRLLSDTLLRLSSTRKSTPSSASAASASPLPFATSAHTLCSPLTHLFPPSSSSMPSPVSAMASPMQRSPHGLALCRTPTP